MDLILDDSTQAKRGKHMEAVATMKDPTTDVYSRGQQYVCSTRLFRQPVMPWGIRLYVKPEACVSVGVSFRITPD